VVRHRETDRLAATLTLYWDGTVDPASPLGRFAETGAVSHVTVDALYEEWIRLHRAAESEPHPCRRGEECWTAEAVVRTLLEYASAHRTRGPVADWRALRDEQTAARVFRHLPAQRS
jgi:predicted acylesterase/phospholipase RssA